MTHPKDTPLDLSPPKLTCAAIDELARKRCVPQSSFWHPIREGIMDGWHARDAECAALRTQLAELDAEVVALREALRRATSATVVALNAEIASIVKVTP